MASEEGVFYRRSPTPEASSQGDLVDRLMAKIAELETRLYERDLADNLPPVKTKGMNTARTSDAAVNHDLLSSLGDAEQGTPSATEWVASWATSWTKRSTMRSPEPRASSDTHVSTPMQAGPARSPMLQSAASASSPAASGRTWDHLKHAFMGRYLLQDGSEEPATDEATQHMREAAGQALAEANERLVEAEKKLAAAEAARQELQEQAQAAKQLAEQVEQLKSENLDAWQIKYQLESEMAGTKAQLEGIQQQHSSMLEELKHMKAHAQIWQDNSSSQMQKLQQESALLQQQLEESAAKLATANSRLVELKAERDSAVQERQVAVEEREQALVALSQVPALKEAAASAQEAAAAAQAESADWQDKFMRERMVRRKLHEQLQVLRGNIRVMCRVRPLQPSSKSVISYPLEGSLAISDGARTKDFEFDAVFSSAADQQQVFTEVQPLIRSCADGYNVCIFAYGQTGSGKTHTMEGPADNPGINRRALQELFAIASEEVDSSWSFQVAVLEIYNEAVHDLLAMAAAGVGSSSAGAAAADLSRFTLDVAGLAAGELPQGMDRVVGLTWRQVSNPNDVATALQQGWKARATASTALNAASSRSHALVSVKVTKAAAGGSSTTSMLHLVDLAGSERIDKSEVQGQQLKEAVAINKSLSALGDVISALQRRTPHVPFRNSKLTQVLQDSLCGSSKVMLVCNLSPEAISVSESFSSLNFASRAAQVELGMARKAAAVAAPGTATSGEGSPDAAGGSLRAEGSSSSISGASTGSSRIPAAPASADKKSSMAMRPASRLSDRASSSSGTPPAPGSPGPSGRVLMAKPARH